MAARGGGGGGGAAHGQEQVSTISTTHRSFNHWQRDHVSHHHHNTMQVSISPADGRLVFSLLPASSSDRTSCWAVMTIANDPSGPCLAFKVKTTKPKRYLVRPSQGTLRPGERRDVTILVPPERQAELLRSLREGNGAPREEDKFQVLYVRVDDRSMGLPGEEQQWVDRFWPEVDRRRVRDCTLDVDFVLSAPSLTAAAASTGPMTVSGRTPPIRSKQRGAGPNNTLRTDCSPIIPPHHHLFRWPSIESGTTTSSRPRCVAPRSPPTARCCPSMVGPRFTLCTFPHTQRQQVSLTAERDTLLNALDTLKFELRRELASQSERGTHVAAGGTVIQDQLSLHKRRRCVGTENVECRVWTDFLRALKRPFPIN